MPFAGNASANRNSTGTNWQNAQNDVPHTTAGFLSKRRFSRRVNSAPIMIPIGAAAL